MSRKNPRPPIQKIDGNAFLTRVMIVCGIFLGAAMWLAAGVIMYTNGA
jgi:hypothetical protein